MKKSSVWLQLSAGQGPEECGWLLAQLLIKIKQECLKKSYEYERVEYLAYEKKMRNQTLIEPESFLSVLLRIEGEELGHFIASWEGSIKWHGQSPFRPKHKRLNWYVGAKQVHLHDSSSVNIEKLKRESVFECMRGSGPGGQHVNKTSSAVRLRHKPTGIAIRVDTERSQHRNKHIALERLQILMQKDVNKNKAELEQSRWMSHYQIERGNPVRTFYGLDFTENETR